MNEELEYSKAGEVLTEEFEGIKLAAYQDQRGVWTIGYGHTSGVSEGMTCTADQASDWLLLDLRIAEHEVKAVVTVPLTQGEFDALVDFTFNLGVGNLRSSTMLRLLNVGDYAGAADEFQKWDMCGGWHVAGLLRRRLAEQKEFTNGT